MIAGWADMADSLPELENYRHADLTDRMKYRIHDIRLEGC
jgi:chorismate synthase